MLALFGRSRIGSGFLRSRIRSRSVVDFRSLIPIRAAALHLRTLALIRLPILRSVRFPVARGRADFEFVQLVPLFVGTIPFRDGVEFSNPATRINWLRIIHADIMNYSRDFIQPSHVINGQNGL